MTTLTPYQKLKVSILIKITAVGSFLGFVFILIARGTDELFPFVNGITTGFLAGLFTAIIEIYLFGKRAKQLKFIWYFALRVVTYSMCLGLILLNVTAVSQMYRFNLGYFEVLQSERFQYYIEHGSYRSELEYIIALVVVVNFTRIMSQRLGQGVLLDYVKGTYHIPVQEQRIFMFVKVKDSEKHLENVGALKYHQFLNILYRDLVIPVLSHQGMVYEYVEDLMVISWKVNDGLKNANCIEMFFQLLKSIEKEASNYLDRIGFIPELKASANCGTVIGSEIGEIKTQIVYQGDTLNTTARILQKVTPLNEHLLISEPLFKLMNKSTNRFKITEHNHIKLRGKNDETNLYGVNQ